MDAASGRSDNEADVVNVEVDRTEIAHMAKRSVPDTP